MVRAKRLTSEDERKLIEYLQKNPVIAASKLLRRNGRPIELAPHQRIALKELWERRPYNLWIFGRGLSKTFLGGLYLTLWGTLFPGQKMGIVSASYRQSQLVFNEIRQFYDDSPYIQQAITRPPSQAPIECSMTWSNKSFVKALPLGDGNKIRGYRFNTVLIDEVAQVDPNIINLSILPMLNVNPDPMSATTTSGNNQIIMCSSAYYQFNHLYEKYTTYKDMIARGNKDYSLLEFTYHDAPPGFINMKNIENMKATMPRIEFLMENENLFPADSDGFFPASLIHSVTSKNTILEAKGRDGYEYVMGIDPARESDNLAIVIIRLGAYNKVVRVHTMHRRTFPEMVKQIRDFMKDYNIVRIAVDQGGGGGTIRDLLAEESVSYNSKGTPEEHMPILPIDPKEFAGRPGKRILDVVFFSSQEVNAMNHSLKADLEQKQILLPACPIDGDAQREALHKEVEEMCEEMRSIVTTPLRNGLLRFDTPSQGMKKDRYSAFLLAAKAARDYIDSGKKEEKPKLARGFWV